MSSKRKRDDAEDSSEESIDVAKVIDVQAFATVAAQRKEAVEEWKRKTLRRWFVKEHKKLLTGIDTAIAGNGRIAIEDEHFRMEIGKEEYTLNVGDLAYYFAAKLTAAGIESKAKVVYLKNSKRIESCYVLITNREELLKLAVPKEAAKKKKK